MIDFTQIQSTTAFCHYTSVNNAREIVSGEMFYMSRLDKMNDLGETKLHDENKESIFVLSFCNSNALSIPLFYLYGGIDGKGCRLEFTAAKVRAFLKDSVIYPVNKRFKPQKKAFGRDAYEIYAGWVYYGTKNGFYSYKNIEATDYPDSFESLQQMLAEKHCGKEYFLKRKYWEYEKEFRIVVKFHKPIKNERIAITVPIQHKERGITLRLGPEVDDKYYAEIKEEFVEYGIIKTKRALDGVAHMELVNRNRDLLK